MWSGNVVLSQKVNSSLLSYDIGFIIPSTQRNTRNRMQTPQIKFVNASQASSIQKYTLHCCYQLRMRHLSTMSLLSLSAITFCTFTGGRGANPVTECESLYEMLRIPHCQDGRLTAAWFSGL
jgi:hypothetical protein